MKKYCMYLRKSRSDMDAERHGEGETLARHEKALMELARRQNIVISKIYREIVSGETLAARPEAQALLADVESGMWDGVLVMEVERLARGDTIDQGIVSQAFKYSGTLIITPMKTYDPSNEFDEEYFEFGLFMSRREYKAIRRRLEQGRLASTKEGKFCGSYAPYGYRKVKLPSEKGYTLEIVPEEAKIVRLIFDMYLNGLSENGITKPAGLNTIATYLNDSKIPSPKNTSWQAGYIKKILSNPAYIGKIRWGYLKSKKQVQNNNLTYIRYHDKDCFVGDGLHPPIIDDDVFFRIAEKMKLRELPATKTGYALQNPLAGILRCGYCGKAMKRNTNTAGYPVYKCMTYGCPNISSKVSIVEERLIYALQDWLDGYLLQWEDEHPKSDSKKSLLEAGIASQQEIISGLENQISKAHDFLEQGIYTPEVFISRTNILSPKLDDAKSALQDLKHQLNDLNKQEVEMESIVPAVQNIIDVYHLLPTVQDKNNLLKEVLEKVEYKKYTRGTARRASDDFELKIFPKISMFSDDGII